MSVLVSLVTHNDGTYIERCLEAVLAQSVSVRVKLIDSGSRDDTVARAKRFGIEVNEAGTNIGYCRGHNWNIQEGRELEWVLCLNADVVPAPEFLGSLLKAAESHPEAGLLGGKLWRGDSAGDRKCDSAGRPLLDSTGMYFTPSLRHFDRGSNEPDVGLYERLEYVFGITGAALLARRRCLEDIRCFGEYFDEDFFAYREDADLAWRARLMGWESLYVPEARGTHVRKVLPRGRRHVSALANYHSVKNRFLLRMKNVDWAVRLRCFPFYWGRDLIVVAGVILWERSSSPALAEAWRLRQRMRIKRDWIQCRRKADSFELARWFSFRPVSRPAGNLPRPGSDPEPGPTRPAGRE